MHYATLMAGEHRAILVCGCVMERNELGACSLFHCPKHAAAQEMYDALNAVLVVARDFYAVTAALTSAQHKGTGTSLIAQLRGVIARISTPSD